jgi:hypothetical protein
VNGAYNAAAAVPFAAISWPVLKCYNFAMRD